MKRLLLLAFVLCSCNGGQDSLPVVTEQPPIVPPSIPGSDTTRPTITTARIVGGQELTLPPSGQPPFDRVIDIRNTEKRPTLEVTFSEPVNILNSIGLRVYEQFSTSTEIPFDYTLSSDRRTLSMTSRKEMPYNSFLPYVYSLDTRIVDDAGLSLDNNTRFYMSTRSVRKEEYQLVLVSHRVSPRGDLFEELTYRNVTSQPLHVASFFTTMSGIIDPGYKPKMETPVNVTIPAGGKYIYERMRYTDIYLYSVGFWATSNENQVITPEFPPYLY